MIARQQLASKGLVAFVADGSVLPRRSGASDLPMESDRAVPFTSPPSLRVTLQVPNKGTMTGMGIPQGVTLIVGGGFHGKSTLLEALQVGVYNKVAGDGREGVVTDANAVKVRAEDGRAVTCVDISPFIDNLPFGKRTGAFTTEDASGSTSPSCKHHRGVGSRGKGSPSRRGYLCDEFHDPRREDAGAGCCGQGAD